MVGAVGLALFGTGLLLRLLSGDEASRALLWWGYVMPLLLSLVVLAFGVFKTRQMRAGSN